MTPLDHTNRGLALPLTLALLTVLTMLLLSLDDTARRTLRQAQASRALALCAIAADGGVALARTLLEEDAARNPASDHLQEPWAQPIAPFPLGDSMVTVTIVDAWGRLDLNALTDPNGVPILPRIEQAKRLFQRLGIDPQAVDRIVDWIDPDDTPMPFGLERSDQGAHPYRPSNAPLASLGELRMIPGLSADHVARLRPYVVAGRATDPSINVNTAPAEVLEAIDPRLTASAVAQLMQARPFASLTELERLPGLATIMSALRNGPQHGFGLTLRSPFYWTTVTATLEQTTVTLEALLVRQGTEVSILQTSLF